MNDQSPQQPPKRMPLYKRIWLRTALLLLPVLLLFGCALLPERQVPAPCGQMPAPAAAIMVPQQDQAQGRKIIAEQN